jgi:hypothetical protein
MYSAERASSNLLLDHVLVQVVLCFSILFIVRIFRVRIECFLHFSVVGRVALVVPEGAFVARICTWRDLAAARLQRGNSSRILVGWSVHIICGIRHIYRHAYVFVSYCSQVIIRVAVT